MKNSRYIFALILGLVLSLGIQAQDAYLDESPQPAQVDEAQWKKAVSGRDYTEASDKKPETPTPEFKPNLDWLAAFKYPIIILLAALVVFILVKIIGGKQNTAVSKTKISLQELDDIEEDLGAADLESMLARALEQKEHKLAIRILYLMTLRDMEGLNWIVYKKEKTNVNYLVEVRSREEAKPFTALTRNFEIIWYGDYPFGEEDYTKVNQSYYSFLNQLKGNGI